MPQWLTRTAVNWEQPDPVKSSEATGLNQDWLTHHNQTKEQNPSKSITHLPQEVSTDSSDRELLLLCSENPLITHILPDQADKAAWLYMAKFPLQLLLGNNFWV